MVKRIFVIDCWNTQRRLRKKHVRGKIAPGLAKMLSRKLVAMTDTFLDMELWFGVLPLPQSGQLQKQTKRTYSGR